MHKVMPVSLCRGGQAGSEEVVLGVVSVAGQSGGGRRAA